MTESFDVVSPLVVTEAMLISTDVTESDYPYYSAITTYGLQQRVIYGSAVFESVQSANIGKTPGTDETWWTKVSRTNRWKLFDGINSTKTSKQNEFYYKLKPNSSINAIAALNLNGINSMKIEIVDSNYGVIYDNTTDLSPLPQVSSWWDWSYGDRYTPQLSFATDIPTSPSAEITITFKGTADLAVGVLILGKTRKIGGGAQYGVKVGIQDYSKKERNKFGDVILAEGPFAKRASFDIKLESSEVDPTYSFFASIRFTPCLWIGTKQYYSTIIYGFFKEFDITIPYPSFSDCSIQIEGLT